MSLSATWTVLPEWLQKPLMAQVISLVEASELFDLTLQQTDEWQTLPPHLFPAAERLALWEMDADPTQH